MKKNKEAKLILKYLGEKNNDDLYSDGLIEDEILKILKSSDPINNLNKKIKNYHSWPIVYHFSPRRKCLLDWYPFKKEASLLEIGSGWGSLTGLFCEKVNKVTAIELTKKRSEISFIRHRKMDNLTIIAGNIQDIEVKEKFDYVTSIGVLEYAGKYTDSDNPFIDFLLKLGSYLKEEGILIIAIENKFGLKYWAGSKEDHTGVSFDSIEGYPEQKSVQTFSKKEIKGLLDKAGFCDIEFYYPVPDYKTPVEIFSDQYLPSTDHNIRAGVFPYLDPSDNRVYVFNERLASDEIVKNGFFDFFTNSFLIFARRK